jgi:signal transduction histidine kinase
VEVVATMNKTPRVLQALVVRPTPPPIAIGIVVAIVIIAVETLVARALELAAPGEAFEPIYLVGVLAVSAVWGLGLALAASLASAIVLAYLRASVAGQFSPFDIENGVVVVIFLLVALFTSLIAGLARTYAVKADQRRRDAEQAAAMLQEAQDRTTVLAKQQAALRRVAELVAREAPPAEVFAAVVEEMARCLHVDNASVCRYEADAVVVAAFSGADPGMQNRVFVGEPFPLEGDHIGAMVLRTGRAARLDSHENASGAAAARIRELGVQSAVGVPIVVGDHLWGMAAVTSRAEPLPPDTEERIKDFADLVATALANAATRAELIHSRARIVAAADEARRRLERDLHDGAQQRLVSLGLQARMAEQSVFPEQTELKKQLSDLTSGLTAVSTELQEISRGIHPAILSEGGLGPALKSLGRRSTVPVSFDVAIEQRLPDPVEIAAYYVAAEALTNAAKHAQATQIAVFAKTDHANFYLSIRDNGVGGADASHGSGLIGLADRVNAVGGQLKITSQAGSGTLLDVAIPLDHDTE